MTTIVTRDTRLLGVVPGLLPSDDLAPSEDLLPSEGGPEYGKADFSPDALNEYRSTREVPTLAHPVIGKSTPLITIRAGGLRTGTLTLWYQDEARAAASEREHARGTTMQLLSPRESVDMYYVAAGRVERRLTNTQAWVVSVDFIEVDPMLTAADLNAVFGTAAAFNAAFATASDANNAWEYIGAAVT
jgi:hypothetical protein